MSKAKKPEPEFETEAPPRRFFLNDGTKLSYMLLEEVADGLRRTVTHARKRLRIKVATQEGKSYLPRDSHILNWILAAYLAMPPATRDMLLERGKAICDERQRSPTPIHFDLDGGPPSGGVGPVAADSPSPRKPRRG